MAFVKLNQNEDINSLIARWKKACKKEDIIQQAKDRMYYLPPSEKQKLKSKRAAIRKRKYGK